jgi:hypothetical protein
MTENEIPSHLQFLWDRYRRASHTCLHCPEEMERIALQAWENAFDDLVAATRDSGYVITATGLVKA